MTDAARHLLRGIGHSWLGSEPQAWSDQSPIDDIELLYGALYGVLQLCDDTPNLVRAGPEYVSGSVHIEKIRDAVAAGLCPHSPGRCCRKCKHHSMPHVGCILR